MDSSILTTSRFKDFVVKGKDFVASQKYLNPSELKQKVMVQNLSSNIQNVDLNLIELNKYDTSYQQIDMRSCEVVHDLHELLVTAKYAKESFDILIDDMMVSCGIDLIENPVIFSDLKPLSSCVDKADFNYSDRNQKNSLSWLYDVVRFDKNMC